MSDSLGFSQRDRDVLKQIDSEIDEAENATELESIARDLRDEVARLRAEFRQHKHEVDQRLTALEDGNHTDAGGDAPAIVHYANIPADERPDLLSTSELIAVTLHDEWADIAWKLGGGSTIHGDSVDSHFGVDTKTKATAKHQPSKLRYELKRSLERDFQVNEIYRGMKRLAKLSGGYEHVGEDGRATIAGGLYKYREVATADNSENRRVLWRVEDDD